MKYLSSTILLPLSFALALSVSAVAADPNKADADNSKKNERDRNGETKTPIDQSNKAEDLKMTQDIRKAVMKEEGLTLTAKNIKIITAEGRVTLRGPVSSQEEKAKIESLAKAASGSTPVDNQLEVKAAVTK